MTQYWPERVIVPVMLGGDKRRTNWARPRLDCATFTTAPIPLAINRSFDLKEHKPQLCDIPVVGQHSIGPMSCLFTLHRLITDD